MYCYKCSAYTPPPGGVQTRAPAPGKKAANFLKVDVRAIGPRAINGETCAKWRYGYSERHGKRVHVAQYFDDTGGLVGQKVRYPDKSFEVIGDLKPAGLFGRHLWRDGGKMVVVTEGELDALSVSQIQGNRWPVVSVPNGAQGAKSAIERSIEWLDKFERVVLLFDNDEPGRLAAAECASILTPGKAYIARVPEPHKDANAVLMAGGDKDTKRLVDAIWGARLYRPDGLVSGEAVWERLVEHDYARVFSLPHSGLQALWHGVRGGEVTMLGAGTGSGKSTFLREIAHNSVRCGTKIGYVALEESVRRSALGLMGIAVNRPLHLLGPAELEKPEVRAAFEEIKDRVVFYDHFGSLASENLLSRLKYLVRGEKCELVFLDHLSIVVSGMEISQDERRTIDTLMTRLVALAQETGASIVVVSHLKRGEGKPHEEGRPVTLHDFRGSGSIAQLSHNVVSIERDQQAETEADRAVSTVRSLKCRHTGMTGIAGHLKYDGATGRLTEYMKEFEGPLPDGGEFGADPEDGEDEALTAPGSAA